MTDVSQRPHSPVCTIRIGDWASMKAWAIPIRFHVFVDEQQVPATMELDAQDPDSLHAVAWDAEQRPIATARLIPPPYVLAQDQPQTALLARLIDSQAQRSDSELSCANFAQIGRMAVLPEARQQGYGFRVLQHLLDAATQQGWTSIMLHAQTQAAAFYAQAGFVILGEPFDEAGIPHVLMVKNHRIDTPATTGLISS